jgi:triacylglycerol esterase/lipase EstA (alpha/beta hydrolase family)
MSNQGRVVVKEPKARIQQKSTHKTDPIIIEEVYCNEEARVQLPESQGAHLFVLVHGFQASARDMQLFKTNLFELLPKAQFLVSRSNEGKTDKSIEILGHNLAKEILTYVSLTPQKIGKISFVGHSLGGLIIR